MANNPRGILNKPEDIKQDVKESCISSFGLPVILLFGGIESSFIGEDYSIFGILWGFFYS